MTRVLTAGRKEPQSGDTRSAVVFLHGYGANVRVDGMMFLFFLMGVEEIFDGGTV